MRGVLQWLYGTVETPVALKSHSISLPVGTPSSLRLAWVISGLKSVGCFCAAWALWSKENLVGFLVTWESDRIRCWSRTQNLLRTFQLVMLIFVLSVAIPAFTAGGTGSSSQRSRVKLGVDCATMHLKFSTVDSNLVTRHLRICTIQKGGRRTSGTGILTPRRAQTSSAIYTAF